MEVFISSLGVIWEKHIGEGVVAYDQMLKKVVFYMTKLKQSK